MFEVPKVMEEQEATYRQHIGWISVLWDAKQTPRACWDKVLTMYSGKLHCYLDGQKEVPSYSSSLGDSSSLYHGRQDTPLRCGRIRFKTSFCPIQSSDLNRAPHCEQCAGTVQGPHRASPSVVALPSTSAIFSLQTQLVFGSFTMLRKP